MHNILILSRDLRHKGGVVNYVNLLIQNLNKDKFRIKHVIQGKSPVLWKNIFLPFLLIYQLVHFIRSLREFKPDIIHINPSLHLHSLLRDAVYLAIANRHYPKNVLIMFHGWENILASKIKNNAFFKKIFLRIYGKAAVILTLSRQYKSRLVEIGISHEKVKVITTMYQLDQGVFEPNREVNKVALLFMSRLSDSKGVYIATAVADLLIKNGYRNFNLMFAGDGPEFKRLQNHINQNRLGDYIQTLGYVRGEQKTILLKQSDIFILPTFLDEGCPIVVLEAMGAGLAIVSTNVGAIPDIVHHQKNGFIIDKKDPQEFFQAVKKLIDDRDLLSQIQKQNEKEAQENYEAKKAVKKMESIYSSIVNPGNFSQSSIMRHENVLSDIG